MVKKKKKKLIPFNRSCRFLWALLRNCLMVFNAVLLCIYDFMYINLIMLYNAFRQNSFDDY